MSNEIKKRIQELIDEVLRLNDDGDWKGALGPAEECYKLTQEHLDPEDELYPRSAYYLALVHGRLGDFHKALSLHDLSLKSRKSIAGEMDPEYAQILENMAFCYHQTSQYLEAEKYVRQAMEIAERTLGENSTLYGKCLNRLGVISSDLGDYIRAEEHIDRYSEIYRETYGEENLVYAGTLINKAIILDYLGKYDEALSCMIRTMDIIKSVSSSEAPEYASTQANYGFLLTEMGSYDKAEEVFLQTLDKFKKLYGSDHYLYGVTLGGLSNVYLFTGKLDQAESTARQALELEGKNSGEKSLRYANNLCDLASVLISKQEHVKAEALLKKSADITQDLVGEESEGHAKSILHLGQLSMQLGHYSDAESYTTRSMVIYKKIFGDEHPDYAKAMFWMSTVQAAKDNEGKALELLKNVTGIHDKLIGQIFAVASERQRMAYMFKIKKAYESILSLVLKRFSDSTSTVRFTLDLVLRRKAIVAECAAIQRWMTLGGKHPELKEKLDALGYLSTQLTRKAFTGPGEEGKDLHDSLLLEWSERKETLEGELAQSIPGMNLERKLRSADRQAVASALPEGSVLVEFVRFREFDFKAIPANGEPEWKPARYIAFVLKSQDPDSVAMIDLGEADRIDKLIAEFRSWVIGEPGEDEIRSAVDSSGPEVNDGRNLRELVFDKLHLDPQERTRIFIAPDGDLNRLPFETLPADGSGRLIDKYQISYLSVGRDVLRFNSNNEYEAGDSFVAADPDFDIVSVRKPIEPDPSPYGWRQSIDLDRTSLKFSKLPGTRPEGEIIASMLGVEPVLAGEVLESRIKGLKSPRVMHIATHGFFLPGKTESNSNKSGGYYENPLLRSGLALTGANSTLRGEDLPDDAEDGILTAVDITGLDLLGTELVVLSACDTGLGVIQAGEGVFGMRRSFMLAGTKTLVMSLWKVPDLVTPILMSRFYENLLEKGSCRDEALREAQIYVRDLTLGEIREDWLSDLMISRLSGGKKRTEHKLKKLSRRPDQYRPFEHPRYWGAFICQGDTRPIRKNPDKQN